MREVFGGGTANSLAPHVVLNTIHPRLQLSIIFTAFVHAAQKREENYKKKKTKNMRGEDDNGGGKVKDNERRGREEKVTGLGVKNVQRKRNVRA